MLLSITWSLKAGKEVQPVLVPDQALLVPEDQAICRSAAGF